MASHTLAIAKASFTAGLLRPDPTSVSKDEIATFHSSLERALSHCSPANIQTCKAWLLHYVASSANRLAGLAKYLVALAGSLDVPPGARPKPSPKRRRLHILYLLNDLFHHSKYHLDTTATFSTVSGSLQPHMVDLLGHAAAHDRQKNPRHHRRLDDLLDIWSEHGYFGPDLIHRLREITKHSASTGAAPLSNDVENYGADSGKKLPGKDAPFIMPSTHGDHSTPYYDLPAGNWLPHIIPNSTIPLHPESIKPLQFLAGPADESLVNALKGFLKDVDQIYGTEELVRGDENIDIDELGQRVTRDEITGDIIDGETYYGWSREFCRQMKKKKTSDSPSRGHSEAQQGLKRRYSDSSMSDRSRRSDSQPRSRSRADGPEARQYGSRPRSRSRGRGRSPLRSRSRESSYSPRQPSPPRFPPPHQASHALPPPPPHPSHPLPPAPSHPYGHQYGFPPPPPQAYSGGWPPAPPPHLPAMPFPPPGPGMNHSAFPPTFYPPQQMNMPPQQGNMHPGQHMPPSQPLPPGQYRFPPPHSGGQGQHGDSWGPPAGRSWR
ncbi:hypothetical protein N7466_000616 [Penicillium verhagenii]|uniref:uncharacterized protein n=1 Tax=Penicillium verhagenii TaxID=1562060 RepID=UPI0025456FE2|nr:uncharacterized protein N7466_000616 [Penicillium verhagenii]KAJ5947601.1 hypothetical protein N7466_000616 [Penicillium verhagenii]